MRRFLVQSSCETLAEGVVFSDGTCFLRSLGDVQVRALYDSLADVEAHVLAEGCGLASVVMLDPEL